MKNLNKQALTEVQLSPEERYAASQNLGRSIFSMIQLAKEKELLDKKKDMDFSGDVEDAPSLKIPIPVALLPQKTANLSIIENPDGTIEERVNKTRTAPSKGPSAGELGLGAGFLTAGLPGAAIGGAAGSLMSGDPAYSKYPEHIKTINHLDGSVEHVYDVKKEKGSDAFAKRHAGKLLGGAGALALLGASNKAKLTKALLATPVALAGSLVGGNILDTAVEKNTKSEILNNPEFRNKVLKDMEFMRSEKQANDQEGFISNALTNLAQHPAKMFMGAQEGFKSARKQYYMRQKEMIARQLDQAQQEYLDTLKLIGSKTAEASSATPLVDAFCNGIAHMSFFGKTASYPEVSIEDGALKRMLSDVVKFKNPIAPVAQTAANAAVNTAAASAYLTYLVKKKMREEPENYMNEKLPTKVELQPV
jgi:hypothetical protein